MQKQTPALRSNEETARIVAFAAQRHGSSQCSSQTSACESNLFKRPQANSSPSPGNLCGSRSPPKNRLSSESFNLNTSRVRQRKFPGPAGLLPDRGRSVGQGQRPNFSSLLNTSASDLEEADEPLSLCSQSTASVLEDGPWLTLKSDFAGGGQELLERYSVSWVKQKAAARQLVGQKIPFLAAVLHSIDCSSPDPCVVLRDSTGEIPGTLHRSVWDSFGGQLIAGSALVLRFVGVLSTGISARRHYLNITSNNIVTIYSSPLCESSTVEQSTRVRKTDVHNWALNQLLQAANNWEEQSKRKKNTGSSCGVTQRSSNPFSSNTFSPGSTGDGNSSARPPLQTSNRVNSTSGSVINPSVQSAPSTSSAMRPPVQIPGRSGSSGHSSSGQPQVPTSRTFTPSGPSPSLSLPGQQNLDPLRQHKSLPSTVGNPSAAQNKFVPKRPTFSSGVLNTTDSASLQTSVDLFSDADDIDISSVLDGIDSESLFGDF
ncbi:hypothetical protein ONE63_010551 [Megalurothrips usitatus]|uniref:Homologous recombination OB-fold protein OB-fold domain-containing protein n=1 Tax=Megalurothrips usitatus TaxID=439358 RepID=A0AAV7XD90_9NEOP|nr:hypothetical protein ONE63_010551 [Megalurothrips usitatus]